MGENTGRKKGGAAEEKPKPKAAFTAEEHLEHIMGVHVQEYYDLLKKDNPASFKKQFSLWEKALGGKSFESIYKPVRAKAAAKKAPVRKEVQARPTLILQNSKGKKWLRQKKITKELRRERVNAKVAKIVSEL